MAVNKVMYGNQTLIDLSTDTVSSSADILLGKVGHLRDGSVVTGTASGGNSNFTLLGSLSLGTISTTSTSSTDTGKSITVKGIYGYDMLVCVCSVNTLTNNRHTCTARVCWLTATTAWPTINGSTVATNTWVSKLTSEGVAQMRCSSNAYGVFANAATISAGNTGDNGQAVITIYMRYNNTYSGTINGSYTMRVYGVKIYDLIGG